MKEYKTNFTSGITIMKIKGYFKEIKKIKKYIQKYPKIVYSSV